MIGLEQEKQEGILLLQIMQVLLNRYEFEVHDWQAIELAWDEQLRQLVTAVGQETQMPLMLIEFHPQLGKQTNPL
jgi:hypothetical protein